MTHLFKFIFKAYFKWRLQKTIGKKLELEIGPKKKIYGAAFSLTIFAYRFHYSIWQGHESVSEINKQNVSILNKNLTGTRLFNLHRCI